MVTSAGGYHFTADIFGPRGRRFRACAARRRGAESRHAAERALACGCCGWRRRDRPETRTRLVSGILQAEVGECGQAPGAGQAGGAVLYLTRPAARYALVWREL